MQEDFQQYESWDGDNKRRWGFIARRAELGVGKNADVK